MGALDLNRVAICMGKVIKLLDEIQPQITNGDDVYENKENCYFIAYLCRVGILDRIEMNPYMKNPMLTIRIPTGYFRNRKESMASALNITIARLEQIVEKDPATAHYVESILDKGIAFYQCEKNFSDLIKKFL